MEQSKTCSKCKAELPSSSFYNDKPSRRRSKCKRCKLLTCAQYRINNSEKCKARNAKYRALHLEKIKAMREKSFAKIKVRERAYRTVHHAERKAYNKEVQSKLPYYIVARAIVKILHRYGYKISASEIPQELIEAKRMHLKLKRLIKEKQK